MHVAGSYRSKVNANLFFHSFTMELGVEEFKAKFIATWKRNINSFSNEMKEAWKNKFVVTRWKIFTSKRKFIIGFLFYIEHMSDSYV